MIFGIYQSLIIHILFVFHGTTANSATSISINGNIEETIGSENMELKCNFTIGVGEYLTEVNILATNNTANDFKIVAAFKLVGPSLTIFGESIFGNVTLTRTESTAQLKFDYLACKTERTYKCQSRTQLLGHEDVVRFSEEINIIVLVPPSTPNTISILQIPSDSSLSSVKHMEHSTSSPLPTVTSKDTETLSALQVVQQNDTTTFNYSTVSKSDHNFLSITPPNYELSFKTSYKATPYSTQQTPAAQGISEGDNITVVCTGDVGKPPAKHVFRKLHNGQKVPLQGTVISTLISEMSENCSYYRTSNLTFQVTAADNNAVIRCVVNSSMADPDMFVETEPLEVYYDIPTTQSSSPCSSSCGDKKEEKSKGNLDDIPTTQSSSTCRSVCVDKKEEKWKGSLGLIIGIVVAVVIVIIVMVVIIACRRRKCKSPTFKNITNDSNPKPVTEPRTGDYDYIALEGDAPTTKSSNNSLEVEDITKHNAEYLKKDEEEKKTNESNTPPQPAVYAQVNEASKLRNKQKTESIDSIGNQEEDTYAETQEGIYDKAGDRRHKEKKNDEHYDSSNNSSKQNSNGDNKLSTQTSQVGSYANQGFEKDDNRKVASVSPTVRSSSGSQNDEQTNSNRNSQSKKGNENIIGTEQTGISEDDSSHRTAL